MSGGLSGRDTPPSIQDGPYGYEPGEVSNFEERQGSGTDILDEQTARKLGREMFSSSTNWLNSGRRSKWNDSLRAFQNEFPSGSKYNTRDYVHRSNLYRPKTRSMVRNDESVTASAFFSNEDVVSVQAEDNNDPMQAASAKLMQALLQYRLTKTIPWFLTVVGARQDADVMGICVARTGWDYDEDMTTEDRQFGDGDPFKVKVAKKTKDEPFIRLLAPENFRFEPGAEWTDPVNKSPYLIELMPTYIQDAEERMESGEWIRISSSALRDASDMSDDVTRRSREKDRVPGKDHDSWKPRAFDICWAHRNIVKFRGRDWHWYSVGGSGDLLTLPQPLVEVELHGLRPYVAGFCVLETHKNYPASKVELTSDLQRAANDDWNLRFDNVKLSLNPRQFVKTGHGIENQDLTRFAPGKVVTVNAKQGESLADIVTWDRPPEPGETSYAESERINLDWDELAGTFTAASVQASELREAPATGMHLLSGAASGVGEYELRVFAETFVEKVLYQLVKLEQAYETDPVVIALAGRNAQLYEKFGLNEITDELLDKELTIRCNVGVGATNPALKMRNLLSVAQGLGAVFGPIAAQGANFMETAKEMFALAGYKDGDRFLKQGFDPQVAQLQQEIQQLKDKSKAPNAPDNSSVQTAMINAQSRLEVEKIKAENDKRSDEMENWREMVQAHVDMHLAATGHAHKSVSDQMGRQHEQSMGAVEHQRSQQDAQQQQDAQGAPPSHAFAGLRDGHVRTFGNGQKWGMRSGKPERRA